MYTSGISNSKRKHPMTQWGYRKQHERNIPYKMSGTLNHALIGLGTTYISSFKNRNDFQLIFP